MLIETIRKAKDGDEAEMMQLIAKFSPAMKKYAYKLREDDALEELQYYFVKLIYTFPLRQFEEAEEYVLIDYIAKSVFSFYVKRLKKHIKNSRIQLLADLPEEQVYAIECRTATYDDYSTALLGDVKRLLNAKEYEVIYALYYRDLSVIELSKEMHVSRQNINQIKNRALRKLKAGMNENYEKKG